LLPSQYILTFSLNHSISGRVSGWCALRSAKLTMLFATSTQVEERRKKTYDESVIYAPCPLRKKQAQQLIATIQKAFSGVSLGKGIGLFQAYAIDGYESDEVCEQQRSKDEKLDWERIKIIHLNSCSSSLSFFDSLGMRFHLPAYICADLRGELDLHLAYHLSDINERKAEKLGLLSHDQKLAVAEYIRFLADDEDAAFDREELQKAVDEFWTKPY
jgi:hypothetical protein